VTGVQTCALPIWLLVTDAAASMVLEGELPRVQEQEPQRAQELPVDADEVLGEVPEQRPRRHPQRPLLLSAGRTERARCVLFAVWAKGGRRRCTRRLGSVRIRLVRGDLERGLRIGGLQHVRSAWCGLARIDLRLRERVFL